MRSTAICASLVVLAALAAPVSGAEGKRTTLDIPRSVAALRAFALASLGRADEAWAEIAWAKGFPSPAPIFWVQLLARLAARDLEGAADIIAARDPVIGLRWREELLASLVLFVAHADVRSEAEAARLRGELRWARSLAPWVDAIAPGVVESFKQAAAEMEAA